jgi:hypothetical protein
MYQQTFLNPKVVCKIDSIVYYQYPLHEQYLISKCGKVYDAATEVVLKSSQTTNRLTKERDYYCVHLYVGPRKYKRTKVHRMLAETFIANAENKPLVDHKNRDFTDNALENLRWATHAENQQNRGCASNNSSGYTGVSLSRNRNKYRAQIRLDGKLTHLGTFPSAEAAAHAYNQRAVLAGFLTQNIID